MSGCGAHGSALGPLKMPSALEIFDLGMICGGL
jgi:hypothetical protein